jgi:hypothetical protein
MCQSVNKNIWTETHWKLTFYFPWEHGSVSTNPVFISVQRTVAMNNENALYMQYSLHTFLVHYYDPISSLTNNTHPFSWSFSLQWHTCTTSGATYFKTSVSFLLIVLNANDISCICMRSNPKLHIFDKFPCENSAACPWSILNSRGLCPAFLV